MKPQKITKLETEAHKTAIKSKLLYPKLSYQIRGAIFQVYKALGPYHKESIYNKALAIELEKRKIPFISEALINITYENKKVGVYRPDFLIDN